MKVAGIDVGSSTAKAVILDNDTLHYSLKQVENTWKVEAKEILEAVLKKGGLQRGDLDFVVATGLVDDDWEGADDWLSDVSCSANGAMYFFPDVRTVIDLGAETSRVNLCDETGIVTDYKSNQKCASGSGMFLEIVASALEVGLDKMGELGLKSKKDIIMNSTCAVYAESEVISLIHLGEQREDILMAVYNMIASKIASMAKSMKFREDVVFIGGGAKNVGLVKALSNALGVEVLVPENPQIINALGAAIEARELVG
ncbi:MAG: hypothetical protein JRI39_03000 [Deltaproteobacteria bacterium]|nr:hypothetical protein [Deltaproteobacteria bacterium]